MRNLHNRLTKLESTTANLTGIIVFMANVTYESRKDEEGHMKEEMISGDFRMHKENAEVLSLEEMQEYKQGYTHTVFLPLKRHREDKDKI